MTNRKVGIIILLLCLCFHLIPYQVYAMSTSDAVEQIVSERECSLTVSYCYEQTVFSDVEVKLYRVAQVSDDFKYTLTQRFEASGLLLDGIQTAGEWNVIRSTLQAHILAHGIAPDFTLSTNEDGQVSFANLQTGMYLAIVNQVKQNGFYYQFDSALIALPGLGSDGLWQYEVSVNAKAEVLPPVDSDEETEYKVLKLWRGDEGRNDRPDRIEVEIFRDGTSYKTVTLSDENHWAYSWSAKNDGSNWTVVERNIPHGYTMTLQQRQTAFVLTNTWTPTEPEEPGKPPHTGDTANILLYVLLMIGSGGMLIILGVAGKKMRL